MGIRIDFSEPIIKKDIVMEMGSGDLDNFYVSASDFDKSNIFFILLASLHHYEESGDIVKAAHLSFLTAYYVFTPLTPPGSHQLALHYIKKAVSMNPLSEYKEWLSIMEKVDALLVKPCYIMDFLPEQVKPDNGGQFFDVEYYLLNSDKYIGLRDRFVSVILKLMCYYHIAILWNGWVDRPSPKIIEEAVCEIMENHSGTLNVLFVEEDALLVFDWDCLNLAVYNPSEKAKSIMEKIAFSEGLFWRKAPS